MKKKIKMPDKILLFVALALLSIGIIALTSASIQESQKDFTNVYGYFLHQLIYGFLLGGILGYMLYRFPYQKLKKIALPMFAVSLFFMILVFIPQLSITTRGAHRWLNFGLFTFQPSELIKLTFIIYLAAWFNARVKEVSKKNSLISFSFLLGILLVLLILGFKHTRNNCRNRNCNILRGWSKPKTLSDSWRNRYCGDIYIYKNVSLQTK